MENKLTELYNALEENIPVITNAIKEADPLSETYRDLLTNFNSTMVIYTELKGMFARLAVEKMKEGEETNGTNN